MPDNAAAAGLGATGVDHVAIAVRDLAAATRFFRDTLGLAYEGEEDVPTEGVRTAFFRAGETRIELVSPIRPGGAVADGPVARFLDRHGEGIHHIALRVPRIERAIDAMRAAGVPLTSDTPRPGAHGARITFIHPKGAHGALVELKQTGA